MWSGEFATEPYEAAWASEAIFFIRALGVSPDSAGTAQVQISADGITWTDEGTAFRPIRKKGLSFIRLKYFGGWLRLNCSINGEGARFRLLVNIALKE